MGRKGDLTFKCYIIFIATIRKLLDIYMIFIFIFRVLIVDWDVHHGQGVQYCFEDDPR